MSATGILLIALGAALLYAGITGQSLVHELQAVLKGERAAKRAGTGAVQTSPVPAGPRTGKPVPVS